MNTQAMTISRCGVGGLGPLLRMKLTLVRNRLLQLIDESPLRLILTLAFVGVIWIGLYYLSDEAFRFLQRFEHRSVIAVVYVFHVFFVTMICLLAFSTGVLLYGALFNRTEPAFLLAAPNHPRSVVTLMYLEALFFSSWSLVLVGLPLMLAIGQAHQVPWHFYATFMAAFLGFVPIAGAIGALLALMVALWMPRSARKLLAGGLVFLFIAGLVWWMRVWSTSGADLPWINGLLGELQYVKAALLPSSWVARAIQHSMEGRPQETLLYLAATVTTGLFFSWLVVNLMSVKLLAAYGRTQSAGGGNRTLTSSLTQHGGAVAFFFLPRPMRSLIIKDVRHFLRDPAQWSQLAILLGLLSLYLTYMPRLRPEALMGARSQQLLSCFLNYGAITLILSTFTSRFVFPMISQEGQQMWLVGLWPLSRGQVMWSKFLFALAVTLLAAMGVTLLSFRALDLPPMLKLVQGIGTLATCIGLCGLAVGLGACLPAYQERNTGKIASGLGGTLNLVASVAVVAAGVGMFGYICLTLHQSEGSLNLPGPAMWWTFAGIVALTIGSGMVAMAAGVRKFRAQEF